MNENSEGTPNPLTPAPEAAAPAPAPAPAAEAPAPAPVTPEPVAAEPVAATPVAVQPKKKKTGLIIGLILGFLAIAGGVVALLFIFVFNKGGDPMTNAITKLLNGDTHVVSISGDFDLSSINVPVTASINAQFDSTAKVGVLTANIGGSFGGMNLDADIEARITGENTAFVKVSGIKDMFVNMLSQSGVNCSGTECDTYIEMMTSNMSSADPTSGALVSLLKLDGKWIKLDSIDFTNKITLPTGLSVDNIYGHKSELIEAYKKNPFITTTTDNVKVTKKNDTVYKVVFDYEKMANFSNEVAKIIGATSTSNATAAQLEESFKDAGTAYVEIDGNSNITRLYFEIPGASAQDLTLAYPSTINVAEPDDYVTSNEIESLLNLFGGGFNLTGGDVTDCDSETDSCTDIDIDIDDDDDDDDIDLDDYDWIWDDDEE